MSAETDDRFFVADLGIRRVVDGDRITGLMEVTPELLVPGHDVPRVSVLATVGDVLLGQLANAVTPTIPLTTDLSTHVLAPVASGRLRMDGRLVKTGRTLVAGEVSWSDAAGDTVAYCWATFMASDWPNDLLSAISIDPSAPTTEPEVAMTEPFTRALGIRSGGPGVAEVDRRPYVLQPTGTLQGGVVCALGEVAAESVLGGPVTSLDAYYLAGIRSGTGRAVAETLGRDLARVEVVDTGRPGRVAAVLRARAGVRDST